MTATVTERRMDNFSAGTQTGRHGPLKVLRGAAWERGWVLVAHGIQAVADRLMPYPTGGFDSAITAINGGPLQVPGADANGGFRVIGKRPNVLFQVVGGAALSVAVIINPDSSYQVQLTTILASTTAAAAVQAIRGHALASKCVDLNYTGTGGGLTAGLSSTAVPYVRIAGIAGGKADNSGDAVNDATLTFGDRPEQVFFGRWGMYFSGGGSLAMMAPQQVWLVDNQTVDAAYTPLLLPLCCSSFENDIAVCEIK